MGLGHEFLIFSRTFVRLTGFGGDHTELMVVIIVRIIVVHKDDVRLSVVIDDLGTHLIHLGDVL